MLEKLLKEVLVKLDKQKLPFALAGGLLASYYRAEIRTTLDIDLALALSAPEGSAAATSILESLALKPVALTLGALQGAPRFVARKTPIAIVAGRIKEDGIEYGLDFLLGSLPWVTQAVSRAKDNLIDFDFAAIPALTVEDLIISKLYSFSCRSDRFKDLDDLGSIFQKGHKFDWDYLALALQAHAISFPRQFERFLPPEIQKLSRKLERKAKKVEIGF